MKNKYFYILTKYIRRLFQLLLNKKSKIYKNLRGLYRFNDLNSPAPILVYENINFNWKYNFQEDYKHNSKKIVYLLSPMQRSGTNYLYYMLQLHPGLFIPEKEKYPPEYFLLTYSEWIKKYISQTLSIWNYWVRDEDLMNLYAHKLFAHIGSGIVNSILEDQNNMLLLKTPDSLGIDNFFYLFPNSKMIILIRDGRDTIESYMKSWGGRWIFKGLAKRWNDRVQKILEFQKFAIENHLEKQICIIEYNLLNQSPKAEIKRIIQFLELSTDLYDFTKMADAPVLGSSVLRGKGEDVNWNPISKPQNFNKEAKWKSWTNKERRMFKKYAGKSLIDLGYEKDLNW